MDVPREILDKKKHAPVISSGKNCFHVGALKLFFDTLFKHVRVEVRVKEVGEVFTEDLNKR